MKKVYLFLAAAVAALSSCVEENALTPVENENQVTIKAVAGETKTTLDGTAVLWEKDDAIKVFLYDGEHTLSTDFNAKDVDRSSASFVGSFDELDFDFADLESAYAISPASAYDPDTKKITVTLPENQVKGVTSEMFLSSAELDPIDLEEGVAEAEFKSALTLLNVVVPEGVKSVSLTATGDYGYLVGKAEFGVGANGTLERKTFQSTIATVYLANENGAALTAGTYPIHVLPGEPKNLRLIMTDMNGDSYVKTVARDYLEPGKYYTVNLTEIFNLEVPETLDVSALGGSFTWSAVGVDTEFTVSENADWLTCEVVDTKGYGVAYVNLSVERNSTGLERTAKVVVKWGENNSRNLVVTQPTLFMDFVYVEETNEIEFEETFGVYTSEQNAKDKAEAESTISKNTFRIELNTADPTKGTYKVTNIFKSASYTHNGQPVTNKGGEFFADYVEGVLTLYRASGVLSYGFTSDIKLAYDSVNKTFSQVEGAIKGYSYTANKDRYIGGYSAAVKVDAPAGDSPLVGDWTQTVTFGANSAVKVGAETATVTVNGDQVTIENFILPGATATGTLSGNIITIAKANSGLPTTYGPVDADIVVNLSEDNKTMSATNVTTGNGWGISVDSWTAVINASTEGGDDTLQALAGTWNQTLSGMSWPAPSATMTITVDGDKLTITDFVGTGTSVTVAFADNKIVIPAGTAIGSGLNSAGPLEVDVVLTLVGNTLTAPDFGIGGFMTIKGYTAVNPGM